MSPSTWCSQWGLANLRQVPFAHYYSLLIYLQRGIRFYFTFALEMDKAIASQPLGPHVVRNYTFNLLLRGHAVGSLLHDDRSTQLKVQWIFNSKEWLPDWHPRLDFVGALDCSHPKEYRHRKVSRVSRRRQQKCFLILNDHMIMSNFFLIRTEVRPHRPLSGPSSVSFCVKS